MGRTGRGSRGSVAPALSLTLALGLCVLGGCKSTPRMPWKSRQAIVDSMPGLPPMRLDAMDGKHLVVMRAPTGGWTLKIDRSEITPDGKRVFLTARRPDPAFMHTQALVDLRVLTEVPQDAHIELVARVLDRNERPRDRIYARVTPAESWD